MEETSVVSVSLSLDVKRANERIYFVLLYKNSELTNRFRFCVMVQQTCFLDFLI